MLGQQRRDGCSSARNRRACLRKPRQQNGRKGVGWTIQPPPTGITRGKFSQADDRTTKKLSIPGQRLKCPEQPTHVGAAEDPIALLAEHVIEWARIAVQCLSLIHISEPTRLG